MHINKLNEISDEKVKKIKLTRMFTSTKSFFIEIGLNQLQLQKLTKNQCNRETLQLILVTKAFITLVNVPKNKTSGLYYKSVMIVTYNCNNSTSVYVVL